MSIMDFFRRADPPQAFNTSQLPSQTLSASATEAQPLLFSSAVSRTEVSSAAESSAQPSAEPPSSAPQTVSPLLLALETSLASLQQPSLVSFLLPSPVSSLVSLLASLVASLVSLLASLVASLVASLLLSLSLSLLLSQPLSRPLSQLLSQLLSQPLSSLPSLLLEPLLLSAPLLSSFSSSALLESSTVSSFASLTFSSTTTASTALSLAISSSAAPSRSSSAPSSTLASSTLPLSTVSTSTTSSSSERISSTSTPHTSSSHLRSAPPTSLFSSYWSTVSVSPDTTITTLVTVPTASSNSDNQSVGEKNGKVIGGVVGAVGGTIVIAACVLLFLFLKKRKDTFVNQSPDFNDDMMSDLNDKAGENAVGGIGTGAAAAGGAGAGLFGFKRLFGKRHSGGGLTGFSDLEHGAAAGAAGGGGTGDPDTSSDDFVYRGVTNNNNLDSVFKTLATNTGQNSTARHSRYNLVGAARALKTDGLRTPSTTATAAPPYPVSPGGDSGFDFHTNDIPEERGHNRFDSNDMNLSDFDIEEEALMPREHPAALGAHDSGRNSVSRFTEEIL